MKETATIAMGCFWGVQALFKKLPGVLHTTVGYTGGKWPDPTYEKVCGGSSGHAEAVEIEFDPSITSYDKLLNIFFEAHDPTTPDRQGPDIGTQYRSAIFYHTDEQRKIAEEVKDRLDRNSRFSNPIVTQIAPAGVFYRAEEYHQDYTDKHPDAVCAI